MFNLGQQILDDFKEYVKLTPMESELRRTLLDHERCPKFLFQVKREVVELRKKGINVNRIMVKTIVHDLSALFVTGVKKKAEERLYSDGKRREIETQEHRKKKYAEKFEEVADSGVYDGLIEV